MAQGSSTWSAEFYFKHGESCPGPVGRGPDRVVLCRSCVQDACPFCGEAITEQDCSSVTDKLATWLTTRSTTDGVPDGTSAQSEDCMWWNEPRYELLPHSHVWLESNEFKNTISVSCTTCRKTFRGFLHIPNVSKAPLVQRGKFAFIENSEYGPVPPKSCDCGGWLQLGRSDFQENTCRRFQQALQTLHKQRSKAVPAEPCSHFYKIYAELLDTHAVEQLLGMPEFFQMLDMFLPTVPYEKWAEAHHCDLVSASDAFMAVSRLLCPVADFLLKDMCDSQVNPIPERLDLLSRSPCVLQCDPKFARSVFGKLAVASNLFSSGTLGGGYPIAPRLLTPALKVFKVMGYELYTWGPLAA